MQTTYRGRPRVFPHRSEKEKQSLRIAFLFGCGGGIFHCPLVEIVASGALFLALPTLLFSSLFALASSATGGAPAQSPRPPGYELIYDFRPVLESLDRTGFVSKKP